MILMIRFKYFHYIKQLLKETWKLCSQSKCIDNKVKTKH